MAFLLTFRTEYLARTAALHGVIAKLILLCQFLLFVRVVGAGDQRHAPNGPLVQDLQLVAVKHGVDSVLVQEPVAADLLAGGAVRTDQLLDVEGVVVLDLAVDVALETVCAHETRDLLVDIEVVQVLRRHRLLGVAADHAGVRPLPPLLKLPHVSIAVVLGVLESQVADSVDALDLALELGVLGDGVVADGALSGGNGHVLRADEGAPAVPPALDQVLRFCAPIDLALTLHF